MIKHILILIVLKISLFAIDGNRILTNAHVVANETFFDGTKSLEFNGLPKFEQEVVVYGFPMGGDSLSVSREKAIEIEKTILERYSIKNSRRL
jgi:hypothetical protein